MSAIEDMIGAELGPTSWIDVPQERINLFADATDDPQWIHVDPERAAAGPFGGTVAHGYLTLSLVPLLGAYVLAYDGCSAKLNYGTEKVRFPQAVRVGSRVRAHGRIADAQRADAGVRVTVRWTLEVEGEPKPACVADTVVLLVP